MSKLNFDKNFWSAVKRKNLLDVLEIVFAESGQEEASEIAKNTTRFTNAAIERMMKACGSVEAPEADEDDEDDEPSEEEYAEAMTTDDNAPQGFDIAGKVDDLEALIGKGKKKKAKKLLAELEDYGLKGSEMKKYKKQIKAL